MNNTVFGDVTFRHGWDTSDKVKLWGKEYPIIVTASAYFEKDGITSEQEQAFSTFQNSRSANESLIEQLLYKYLGDDLNSEITTEQLISLVVPKTLVFERDGAYALLLDYTNEPENGLAVQLAPNENVLTQDEYL